MSTSSRVLRLRLRLARVFSPAVGVRVACVWRAGGGEARRVSSRGAGVGFDAAGRAVVRSRCARGAGERTIETTRTRNRAALFVVAEAGLLVVTRAVLVYFINRPRNFSETVCGPRDGGVTTHQSRALGSRLCADRALEGIGAFAEAPAMTDTTPEAVRTFRWPVRGWSSLGKKELPSQHFDVGGVSWRIDLYPQGDRDSTSGYVSIYLTAVDAPRKMHVNYTLTIEGAKKHDDENAAVVSARAVRERCGMTFQKGAASWGWRRFVSLTTLNDPDKGLVSRDDTVVITAEVCVSNNTPECVSVNCQDAAANGELAALKYLRSRNAPWDEATCASAAWVGNLDILKWARKNGCPWDKRTCDHAARNGHLELLKWARKNGASWDEWTSSYALKDKHFKIVRYIADERERALKVTDAIPGLLNQVFIEHVLKPDRLLAASDLARLRAVSPTMRDAVVATGRILTSGEKPE